MTPHDATPRPARLRRAVERSVRVADWASLATSVAIAAVAAIKTATSGLSGTMAAFFLLGAVTTTTTTGNRCFGKNREDLAILRDEGIDERREQIRLHAKAATFNLITALLLGLSAATLAAWVLYGRAAVPAVLVTGIGSGAIAGGYQIAVRYYTRRM
jgi:hypothetical protein